MVKIRLEGTLDEIDKVKESMVKEVKVLSVSKPYKNRGENEYYRVYIDCEVENEA